MSGRLEFEPMSGKSSETSWIIAQSWKNATIFNKTKCPSSSFQMFIAKDKKLCFLYEHRYRLEELLASGLLISVCRTQIRWMPSAENIVSVPASQRLNASQKKECCTDSKASCQSKVMAPPLLFLVEFLSASSTVLTIQLTGWILQMTEISKNPAEIPRCPESSKICKSSNLSTAEACALAAFSLPPASTWSNCPGWSDRDALWDPATRPKQPKHLRSLRAPLEEEKIWTGLAAWQNCVYCDWLVVLTTAKAARTGHAC